MEEKIKTPEVLKVDYSKMPLKGIYWNMKQDMQYIVADGKGYGDKGAVTEGQVQKAIKELEKRYKVLVTVTWEPHIYDTGLNYDIVTKNDKVTTHVNGAVTVEKGDLLGVPYMDSGNMIITLERIDSDEKMEFVYDYAAAGNNLTFMKAVRRTYHTRVNLLKWLGIATEEEDPEIKSLKEKEDATLKALEIEERQLLQDEWVPLFTRTDLTPFETKKLEEIKKWTRSANEVALKKFLTSEDQSKINIAVNAVKKVRDTNGGKK